AQHLAGALRRQARARVQRLHQPAQLGRRETFSSPRRAASTSIILRRRRVAPRPRLVSPPFTASRPTASISRLVASLSEKAVISAARSRQLRLTRSPSTSSTPPPPTRGSRGCVTASRSRRPASACKNSSYSTAILIVE